MVRIVLEELEGLPRSLTCCRHCWKFDLPEGGVIPNEKTTGVNIEPATASPSSPSCRWLHQPWRRPTLVWPAKHLYLLCRSLQHLPPCPSGVCFLFGPGTGTRLNGEGGLGGSGGVTVDRGPAATITGSVFFERAERSRTRRLPA